MDEKTRKWRELDALKNIATELVRLRMLKEHELGVRLEESRDGAPYVPRPYVPRPYVPRPYVPRPYVPAVEK
jgi:hypothetical protein